MNPELVAIAESLARIETRLTTIERRIGVGKRKSFDEETTTGKRKYADGVYMKTSDYEKVIAFAGGRDKAMAVIEHFSGIKKEKGYTYANDYLPLMRWGFQAYSEWQKGVDIMGKVHVTKDTADANAEEEMLRRMG
jgi:hypothetical protein